MSNISAVASSPPATGTTRDCDLSLDSASGNRETGTACSACRNNRTGVIGSVNGVLVSNSSTTFTVQNGRTVPTISSGLGNGAMISWGIQVLTDNALAISNPAAYSTRRGVTRIISTLFASSAVTPNNDVGMQAVIGGAALASLLPSTGGGAGKVGFGIWMIGNVWVWAMKKAADLANTVSDSTGITVGGVAAVVTTPMLTEMRIYDDAGGPSTAGNNARCELWINNLLQLTRYWVNPTGIATATLPPLIAPIYPQIRNTSTGPANVFAGDFCLIHGPNNAGTLTDV